MLFFNTLLCKQGRDNRLRFLLINVISYISFLFVNTATDHKLLTVLVLFISAYFSAMSALRRLKDANLNNKWLSIAIVTYLLTGLSIIFITLDIIDLLLLIPATLSALLLTYPSKNQHKRENKSENSRKYQWGYNGPIDLLRDNLSSHKNNDIHSQQVRIEPVFSTNEQTNSTTFEKNRFEQSGDKKTGVIQDQINAIKSPTKTEQITSVTYEATATDLGETIRQYIFMHKKIILILIITLLSLFIIFNIAQTTPNTEVQPKDNNYVVEDNNPLIFKRIEKLDMPDNFTLFFNQYDGLIIHWQADQPSANQQWSIINAEGDDSCQKIRFNKGEVFRTLTVTVEDNINHYANFSPLDTQKLLQAIAFRGDFTLCDFKFSLKGSQAALNKNSKYAEQIHY